MDRSIGRTIVRLLVISLVVGLVLSWLDIRPQDILKDFGHTVERVYGLLRGAVGWAGGYILLGSVIVVPLWLLFAGLDYLKRK